MHNILYIFKYIKYLYIQNIYKIPLTDNVLINFANFHMTHFSLTDPSLRQSCTLERFPKYMS